MEELAFEIDDGLAGIEPVQEEIKYLLQARGLRLKTVHATLLALGEWLEAVIAAADSAAPALPISVRLTLTESLIRLRVLDSGPPLASTGGTAEFPQFTLLRALVDEFKYRPASGHNEVELVKYLGPAS